MTTLDNLITLAIAAVVCCAVMVAFIGEEP